MESLAFFECARNPREVPGILIRCEAVLVGLKILWPEDPGIIRQPPLRIRTSVAVNKLPCRWHSDGVDVEEVGAVQLRHVERAQHAALDGLGELCQHLVVSNLQRGERRLEGTRLFDGIFYRRVGLFTPLLWHGHWPVRGAAPRPRVESSASNEDEGKNSDGRPKPIGRQKSLR